ncbi:unnamed protein product [Effrenium voratum]|uniref:Uncharacterized protein n=1 Tax=Effrenium voratum TaxID=2562239 RepID=A0AA36J748_9DINO|nr:unnamed protein product [Effrenium voratum]
MPRIHLESLGGGSARLAEMMGASSVSSSSLMAMLKQKVDIKQTLGISSELAEAVQAAYQEKLGAGTGDECSILDILCCMMCIHCCLDVCCNDRRRSSWMQKQMSEPGQQSMDADAPEKTSVLDISKFSSADFQEILRSKEMSAKERFGLWLFGHKFGNTEKTKLQQCLQKMKQVLPELAEKDGMDLDELRTEWANKTDMTTRMKLVRRVAAMAVLNRAQGVSQFGLAAVSLEECGPVLCAGELQYELDADGLHKCTWQCPAGQTPDTFQMVGLDMAGEKNMTLTEAEAAGKLALEEADMDSSQYSHTKSYQMWKGLSFDFYTAYGDAPLKLLQMTSVAELGPQLPVSMRYHGTCRGERSFRVAERVVYTGSGSQIPHGAIVKIERLPGDTPFLATYLGGSEHLGAEEYEVKYLGQRVIVPAADLTQEGLAKVVLDPGLQKWMQSTGEAIEVSMPGRRDPSRRQQDTTFWFPTSKKED